MGNKYTCAKCKNEFECDRSDEEAIKEYEDTFGEPFDENTTALVCDDCYNKMNEEYPISQFIEDSMNGQPMEKNKPALQIPEANFHALGEAISKTMEEAGNISAKLLSCVGRVNVEATILAKKIGDALHETYLANGAPYGDSQVGFFLWLKEEQEHARKEGENG